MNVGQLIKKLSSYPKGSVVIFQDHDNNESEFNSVIGCVTEASDELTEVLRERGICGPRSIVIALRG